MRRLLALALLVGGCGESPAATPPEVEPPAEVRAPDPARGRALMTEHECNRCHEGTGLEAVTEERSCVGCHQAILDGSFDAPRSRLRAWERSLVSLNHAPSLAQLGGHLRAEWIASFLVAPHDVRPGLAATMPRLGIDEGEAADIAAALTEGAPELPEMEGGAEIDAGLALLTERGCLSCHAFQGPPGAPADAAPQVLAPDLRHTRQRMSRAMLLRWLEDPSALRPGTPMPDPGLSPSERQQIADAILDAPLEAAPRHEVPERLPVLEREVRWDEVAERVLSRTCWHCHADPDFAMGDGGAGNTGGFGYEGRGVDLLTYAGASSGYIADDGERRSLFADDDGTPHLIRVLMARHAEVAGEPDPGVTGMPLGLPPLSLEDIQLVESWIAQGRPN